MTVVSLRIDNQEDQLIKEYAKGVSGLNEFRLWSNVWKRSTKDFKKGG